VYVCACVCIGHVNFLPDAFTSSFQVLIYEPSEEQQVIFKIPTG